MSRRPAFLDQPLCWTRAPRTSQTRVDYACAVEHNVPRKTSWHPAERWFAPLLIVVIVLLAAGWL